MSYDIMERWFFPMLLSLLALSLRLISLWFLLTALLFWKRPASAPRHAPQTRFCCLIPARNEEAVIAALIRSLQEQR